MNTEKGDEGETQCFRVPKTLIFNESANRQDWSLPDEPKVGTVGCFTADRAPNWDLFVIVGYDQETHTITAIFPRLRLNDKTGTIEVGQDKLNESFETTVKCECPPPCQGDDFGCHCGAYERINDEYLETFKEMPEDTLYESVSFTHYNFRKFNWIYHEHVWKKSLKELDYPMEKRGKCCRVV